MHNTQKHISPTLEAEEAWWKAGSTFVAGLDEAGRGAWAGPVYAAAVILPPDPAVSRALEGVRDSKLLRPARREALVPVIEAIALTFGVGWADAGEIDHVGIVPATRLAMGRALAALSPQPQALVIDALCLPEVAIPQRAFPFADALSLSVAAASILAKVSRDRWMCQVAEVDFPGYSFARHKGYGTAVHRDALGHLGISSIHRASFQPMAGMRDGINYVTGREGRTLDYDCGH